ncbi:peptidoglycan/LPS O-acetylase OafA/YrhL [Stakelama pacifica]|uniref:Peptidoglycan/LPS O-acetylase OafA/YrhL n=2 Tax=Stakelama TaxID=1124625 RepID=A0A4R6FU60_9SPHN|nr:peptidoglycan/LPS O-acetylase OafA/YrhL [Stakelama pacifica]
MHTRIIDKEECGGPFLMSIMSGPTRETATGRHRDSVDRGIGLSDAGAVVHEAAGVKPYIHSHTALRGMAALFVFFYHFELIRAFRIPLGSAAPVIARGYAWVDLFFILSGFVIALTYQGFLASPSKTSVTAFAVARIARILPFHILALTYLAVLMIGTSFLGPLLGGGRFWKPLTTFDFRHFLEQLSLLQIWDAKAALSWNIPSWSISAEMHVYLIFPLLAFALARAPVRSIVVLCVTSVSIYLAILHAKPSLDILTPFALLRCFAGFALGVVLYRAHERRPLRARPWMGLTQCGALILIAAIFLSGFHDVFLIPAFATLIYASASDAGPIGAIARTRAAQRLGTMSYALYLLNFPVLMTAELLWPQLSGLTGSHPANTAKLVWAVVLTAIILALAALSHDYVEQPMRRMIVRKFTPS